MVGYGRTYHDHCERQQQPHERGGLKGREVKHVVEKTIKKQKTVESTEDKLDA